MLTKHERMSRKQRIAGTSALAALTLGGLAITASGTQAAERVRSGIESTTGVDIAALELPIPQTAPTPPAAPAAPEAAEAPTPPDAPEAPEPGVKKVKRVVVMRDKDGKVTTHTMEGDDVADLEELEKLDGVKLKSKTFVFSDKNGSWTMNGAPMPPMPPMQPMPPEALAALKNMPQVSSRSCKAGEGGSADQNVIHTNDGKIRRVIICTDRIERQAKLAGEKARDAQVQMVNVRLITRDANRAALQGLRTARNSVQSAQGMTDAQRSEALKGIDEAIREMEGQKDDD